MERRRFLAVATLLSGGAGCLGASGDGGSGGTPGGADSEAESRTPDDTGTDSTDSGTHRTPRPHDDISIAITTTSPNGTSVELAVSSEGGTIVGERVVVSPDGATVVDTGIDEKGRYELTITPEGRRTRSYPFRVGDYDLRMGSNVVVSIARDVVRIMMEE